MGTLSRVIGTLGRLGSVTRRSHGILGRENIHGLVDLRFLVGDRGVHLTIGWGFETWRRREATQELRAWGLEAASRRVHKIRTRGSHVNRCFTSHLEINIVSK